jgi:hypothetical protein
MGGWRRLGKGVFMGFLGTLSRLSTVEVAEST